MVTKGLDFGNRTPLYIQIVSDIKNLIARGDLCPGEQLPTHQELARKYKVSLITVKKAMANLVSERVLYTRMGMGTYVAQQPAKTVVRSGNKMIGLVLRDNEEMGLLMQRRGYAPHRDEEDPGVMRYIKPLVDVPPPSLPESTAAGE